MQIRAFERYIPLNEFNHQRNEYQWCWHVYSHLDLPLCGSNTTVRFDHCLFGFCVMSLLCYAVLSVLSSIAIILVETKELVVLLWLTSDESSL